MNLVEFPEITLANEGSLFRERLKSESASRFFCFLFKSIVGSDIYSSYLKVAVKNIEDDYFEDSEGIQARISRLKGAELPFIITADHDYLSGLPTDFHIQRFMPDTGRVFFDGFVSFADYQNTELIGTGLKIVDGYNGFSQEQCERLLEFTKTQMEAGIDPRDAYSGLLG